MTIRSPNWAVLATLSAGFFLIVGCGGDSPTSSGPPVKAEILSYEAVTGDWEGELQGAGIDFRAEASITRDSATRGEAVGTFLELTPETGALICDLDLLAEDSDPPVYWFDYTVSDETPDCANGTFRWEYDAEAETVTVSWQREGSSGYNENGPMTRSGG